MLFLSLELNLTVRPKLLRELKPGARIVSHWHDMGDWQPQETLRFRAVVGSDPFIYGPSRRAQGRDSEAGSYLRPDSKSERHWRGKGFRLVIRSLSFFRA